jgi:hypothetical protein
MLLRQQVLPLLHKNSQAKMRRTTMRASSRHQKKRLQQLVIAQVVVTRLFLLHCKWYGDDYCDKDHGCKYAYFWEGHSKLPWYEEEEE